MKNEILFKKRKSYVLFDRETLNAIEIDKQTKLVYDNSNQKKNLSKKEEKIIRLIRSNLSSTKKNALPKLEIGSFRVVLTEKCNLNCKNCFVKRSKVNLAEMSNKTLTSFIKTSLEKANSGEIKYHFFGGEPLLKFDLIKLAVELSKSKKASYSLTTNGLLITEDIAKFFKKYNFEVGISIDGLKKEHNLLRGGNSNFSGVLKGFRLLEKFNVKRFVLITPYSENINSFPKILRFFIKKLNVKRIVINTPFKEDFGWMIDGKTFSNILVESIKLGDKYGIEIDSAAQPVMYSVINKSPRISPCFYNRCKVMLSVSPAGKISYCSQYWGRKALKDKSKDHEKTFVRKKSLSCENCFAKNVCGGPCPVYQALSKKTLDENKCAFQKEFLKTYLLDEKL